MSDQWADKATFGCGTCQWFQEKEQVAVVHAPKATPGLITTPGRDRMLGRCRRHAPTLGGYPVVTPADWCGDHKLGLAPR
jgi:hypothetical protein